MAITAATMEQTKVKDCIRFEMKFVAIFRQKVGNGNDNEPTDRFLLATFYSWKTEIAASTRKEEHKDT